MTMWLDEFIPVEALRPLRDERVSAYANRAARYFRSQFPRMVVQLDDVQLLKVVHPAYHQAGRRGIRSEANHMKYLIATACWGSHFDGDPQFRNDLDQAGWQADGGAAAIAPLLGRIGDHLVTTQTDMSSPDRILRVMAGIYSDPFPQDMTEPAILSLMHHAWPARVTRIGESAAGELARHCHRRMQVHGLEMRDFAFMTCCATYLGHRFDEDPLHPWAQDALRQDGRDTDTRRQALTDGFMGWYKCFLVGKSI